MSKSNGTKLMDSSAMENKEFREAHIQSLKYDLIIFCGFSVILGASLSYALGKPALGAASWIPAITSGLVVLYGLTAINKRLNWFK